MFNLGGFLFILGGVQLIFFKKVSLLYEKAIGFVINKKLFILLSIIYIFLGVSFMIAASVHSYAIRG